MSTVLFNNLLIPVGVLADANQNIYFSRDTGFGTVLTKVAVDGTVVGEVPISTGFLDIESAAKLAAVPSSGQILALRADGLILGVDPTTLGTTPLLDLRSLTIDTSSW